jgi:hypothetical protein
MFTLLHSRNMTKVLEINVVVITNSLHFRSPYKHGGGGCTKRQAYVLQKDVVVNEGVDLNEDKMTNRKNEVNIVDKSSRSSSCRERMRGFSPHRHPLKDQMKN